MYMFLVLTKQKHPSRLMELWSTQGSNWEWNRETGSVQWMAGQRK